MKKVVLKLDLHDDKCEKRAMKTASGLSGVDSVSMDRDQKMTLTGDIDAVVAVRKLRKVCHTEIVSVGPAKGPEKKDVLKKPDEAKKDIQSEPLPSEIDYRPPMPTYCPLVPDFYTRGKSVVEDQTEIVAVGPAKEPEKKEEAKKKEPKEPAETKKDPSKEPIPGNTMAAEEPEKKEEAKKNEPKEPAETKKDPSKEPIPGNTMAAKEPEKKEETKKKEPKEPAETKKDPLKEPIPSNTMVDQPAVPDYYTYGESVKEDLAEIISVGPAKDLEKGKEKAKIEEPMPDYHPPIPNYYTYCKSVKEEDPAERVSLGTAKELEKKKDEPKKPEEPKKDSPKEPVRPCPYTMVYHPPMRAYNPPAPYYYCKNDEENPAGCVIC